MKKFIAILMVLTVVAGFAFADATVNEGKQRITIETDVKEAVPQFLFQGSLTSYSAGLVDADSVTTAENTFNGAELTSDALKTSASIADANILAYFVITQNEAKFVDGTNPDPSYARTQKTIEFSFTIGNLVQQTPANAPQGWTAKSVPGSLVANSAAYGTVGTYSVNNTSYNNMISFGDVPTSSSQTFTATYNGRVQNTQEIGHFQAQWNQDPTVPNGVYKADITLTISVQ